MTCKIAQDTVHVDGHDNETDEGVLDERIR